MAKKNSFQDKAKKLMDEAKTKLEILSKEAGVLAKKGEVELGKMSHVGKLQAEIAMASVKREQLYWKVGKKAVELFESGKLRTVGLKSLCSEAKKLGLEITAKQKEITKVSKKTGPKKTTGARRPAKKKTVRKKR